MRWVAPIAVAAGVVAFVGFGMDYLAGRNANNSSDSAATSAESAQGSAMAGEYSGPVQSSGTDYSLGTLDVEPIQTLTAPNQVPASGKSDNGSVRSAPQASAPQASALKSLSVRAVLQDCLDAIQRENAGGTISVESVDYARFDGSPAVVVRFSAANGRWAWASGPACGTSGGGAAELAKVPVR